MSDETKYQIFLVVIIFIFLGVSLPFFYYLYQGEVILDPTRGMAEAGNWIKWGITSVSCIFLGIPMLVALIVRTQKRKRDE